MKPTAEWQQNKNQNYAKQNKKINDRICETLQ